MATRTTPTALTLLFLLAAASPLRAQFTDDWRRLDSGNFVLVGNADRSAIRRVGERLEEFRAAFLALMPAYRESGETGTTVVVFRDDDAFRPFKPEGDVSGYFTSGPYRNYIALTAEREMERTIYHEYVHQLTKETRAWPRWLREGVAEFYSTIEVRSGGEKLLLGRPIVSHVLWLRQAFMPLREFLDPDTRYDGIERTTTLYAEAWALVHFIQFGRPELAGRIDDFLQAMSDSGNDVAASVEAAFGTDIDTMESQLRRYVGSPSLPAGEKTLEERLEEVDLPDSGEIPESEAGFHLGDLLLHLGRDEEAGFFFERSLELGGEASETLTGLYVLNNRRGDTEAALEFLARAVHTPDAGYLPHLFMARELLEAGPFREVAGDAESHLRRAIRENPRHADGHFWLGRVLMRRPESIEDAVGELEAAFGLGGGDPLMGLTWARALWLSGNDARALAVLGDVGEADLDPLMREQVDRLADEVRWLASAGIPTEAEDTEELRAGTDEIFLPPPGEGLREIEGWVTYIGCSDGFQLAIASGEQAIRLIGPGMDNVRLVSYSPRVMGRMPCGAIEPALPARVVYRPAAGSVVDGEPIRIDFLR